MQTDENKTPTPDAPEERIHHPFSPSSLPMREACPKFEQHSGDPHEKALLGTIQHNSVDTGKDDNRLSDRRARHVKQCIEYSEERLAAYPGGTMYREVYRPVDDRFVVIEKGLPGAGIYKGTTAGYSDVTIISADKKKGECIDWKFGDNKVDPAETNLQGIAYMMGAVYEFPMLEEFTVRFIMPALDWDTDHTFLKATFDANLLRIRVVVARAVEARRDPNDFSMARPNISSCLFCEHIGRCPKVTEIAIELGKKYRPLLIPNNVTPSTLKDAKDVGIGIRLAAVVAQWAESFRRQATAKTIDDPDFIPDGYKLVDSQKRSVQKARALGELAKAFLPREQHAMVEDLFDISLGDLEELIKTHAPRGSKEQTAKDFGQAALQQGALKLGARFAYLRQDQ